MADMGASDFPQKHAEGGPAGRIVLPEVVLKTDVQLYDGATVFLDPNDSMLAKSAGASGNPLWMPEGVAADKILGNGAMRPHLTRGPHVRKNSATSGETVPATLPKGWPLYAKDNQTVSLTNGGGLYPFLGVFGGMTGDSTPLPIVWIGIDPFGLIERGINIPLVYGHADLTDNDTSQDFTIYTLPGPCRVISPPCVDSLTVFTGGGAGAVTMAIGADSDPDAIGDEKSIFTGGAVGAFTAGVLGYAGALLAAGTVIKVQFVTDATLLGLTAGAAVANLRLRPGA